MRDVLGLPFDQYQRYRLVADLLAGIRPAGRTWAVLDVGGRTALLRDFLPEDRVTLVDLEPSDATNLVLGDGSRLPFADAAFDVVAAFDTLEHVPTAQRPAFLAECRRVARSYVVLAGPYDAPAVAEAETILERFLRDKLGVEHRYLAEHRHHGLPVRAEVEAQLARLGARVASFGHGNLERWLALISLSMYMDYAPPLRAVALRLHHFYNARLFADDIAEPVYRHAVVASLGGAPLPIPLSPALSPPPSPPASTCAPLSERAPRAGSGNAPGATASVRELAFELVAFDRERDVYEKEWRRLEDVNAGLAADLEGHRASLAQSERIRAEQAQVMSALARDLEGHRRQAPELEAEIGHRRALEAGLEARLAEYRRVVGTLQQDLAGHRATLAQLRVQVQGQATEIERRQALREKERREELAVRAELERLLAEHREVVATLERDLAGHRQALAEVRRERELRVELETQQAAALRALGLELDASRRLVAELRSESEAVRHERESLAAELSRTSAELASASAQIEALHAELRGRWKNLKRALSPSSPRASSSASNRESGVQ